jgi:hypothetical protein
MSTLDRGMQNFLVLAHADQTAAIKHLAAQGMGEYAIAAATKLSVEQVRGILGGKVSQ